MAAIVELDPIFRQALKFLHSSNNDAAENIRKALDDVIKQKHGPNKMLINTLSKKYIAEESKATGSGTSKGSSARRSSNNKSSDSSSSSPVQIIAVTTSAASTTTVLTTDSSGQTQEIPVIISLTDTPPTTASAITTAVDDNAMDTHINDSFFDDLTCVTCRRIDLSAKNRLIECTRCTSLYHQECHSPVIKDAELSNGQESSWSCNNCKIKRFKSSSTMGSPQGSKSHHSSSPNSSSSSNSDVVITGAIGPTFNSSHHSSSSSASRKDKNREHGSSSKSKSSSSSSSSRHHSHHHSSSSSSRHERSGEKGGEKGNSSSSSSGSSKSSSVTPNIHIISADKRLQNMKKKAAKTQESKRKK